MSHAMPSSSSDGKIRQSIRDELEATRIAFHSLLLSLSDEDWNCKTGGWSVGEIMVHLTLILRTITLEIDAVQQGKNIIKPPAPVYHRLNVTLARIGAWRQTAASVAERYDAAHAAMLAVVACIQSPNWNKTVRYPDLEGSPGHQNAEVSLKVLCHFPAQHFQYHLQEIKQALRR